MKNGLPKASKLPGRGLTLSAKSLLRDQVQDCQVHANWNYSGSLTVGPPFMSSMSSGQLSVGSAIM